jgi:hypothetical protein
VKEMDECKVCGGTRHVGGQRCNCATRFIWRQRLGNLYCKNPILDSKLIGYIGKDAKIGGKQMAELKPHLAGVVLHCFEQGKSVKVLRGSRILDLRGKSNDFEANDEDLGASRELWVLYLEASTFSEKQEEMISDVATRILRIRRDRGLASWVVLEFGLPEEALAKHYNEALTLLIRDIKTTMGERASAPVIQQVAPLAVSGDAQGASGTPGDNAGRDASRRATPRGN